MFRSGHGKKSSSSPPTSSSSSFSSSSSSSFVSLQIKEDDKFFSKLLSREDDAALEDRDNNSSQSPSKSLYYGETQGSVPFLWESRPGTPKNPNTYPGTYSSSPSTLSSTVSNSTNENFLRRKQHNPGLSGGVASRVKTTTRGNSQARSHRFSSSDSSSPGLVSYSSGPGLIMRNVDSGRVRLDDYDDNNVHDDSASSSPDSTLKFVTGRKHRSSGNKLLACTPVEKVKSAFLSVVGYHASSHGHSA